MITVLYWTIHYIVNPTNMYEGLSDYIKSMFSYAFKTVTECNCRSPTHFSFSSLMLCERSAAHAGQPRTSCFWRRTSAASTPARSTRGTAGSHATWAARSRSWRNASDQGGNAILNFSKKRVASNLGDVLLPNQTDDNCWPELNYDSLRKNLLTSSDENSKIYCT